MTSNNLAERMLMKISAAALIAVLLGVVLLLGEAAKATNTSPPPPPPSPPPQMDQSQGQDQAQDQIQDQAQGQGQQQGQITEVNTGPVNVTIGGGEGEPMVNAADTTTLTTTEGDTSIDLGDRNVENNSSNVVLVPNNNTESCIRVFGLSFGKDGTAGAIGFPWRSAPCDFEQAADDAFAGGERDLGWFWKCQNKNLHKRFKAEGEDESVAIDKCHSRMMGGITQAQMIDQLVAEVQRIKYEYADEMAQYRQKHASYLEEQTEKCNESKNRISEACKK